MKINKDVANCMPNVGLLFLALLPVIWKNDFAFFTCTIVLFLAIIISAVYLFTNNTSWHDVIKKICSNGIYDDIYSLIIAFFGIMVTISTATDARAFIWRYNYIWLIISSLSDICNKENQEIT